MRMLTGSLVVGESTRGLVGAAETAAPLNFCEFRGFRGRTDSRRVNSVGGITFVFV